MLTWDDLVVGRTYCDDGVVAVWKYVIVSKNKSRATIRIKFVTGPHRGNIHTVDYAYCVYDTPMLTIEGLEI